MLPPRPLYVALFCLTLLGCGNTPSEPLLVFGKRGANPGDFLRPRVIASNASTDSGTSELYIIDFAWRMQVFDSKGNHLRGWDLPQSNGRPAGMTVDSKNQIYIADSHAKRVLVYSSEGKQRIEIKGEGEPGEFQYLADVAVDEEGNLFISEFSDNKHFIRKVSSEGKYLQSFGDLGVEAGQFSRPRGLCYSKGELFVADSCNHRIQIFDKAGKFLRQFGTLGNKPGELQYPYDLTISSEGFVYVAEWGGNRVQKFDKQGKALGTWGSAGRNTGQLSQPWGIACDKENNIFVIDTENNRVQKIRF